MAALNFPNSPSLNDTHTENGVTFKWNGAAWDRLGDIGAQGAAGAAGAQGAVGAAGAQGSTGPVAGSSTQVVYKDGSNNPAGSANFTFDGTNLTVGGNVSIGGTLTYEDVTNIDSVGIITARAGVKVPDSQKVFLGTGDDLQIYHDGSHSYIDDAGTGNLYLRSGTLPIQNLAGSKTSAVFNSGGGQELYHNNSKKFETTTTGVTVTNDLVCDGTGDKAIRWSTSGTNKWSLYHNNAAGALVAYDNANNAERLRILSTGTVNIGDQGLSSEYLGSTVKIRKDQNSVTRLSLRNEDSGSGSASAIQVGAYGNSWMLQCGSAANDSNAFTIRVDGSANSNTGSEKLRITTDGNLIVDAGGDAQDIQIKSHSANSGHGIVYLRGNASNESSSIHLNHYGHADYHISAGRAGNGLFSITRTNGGSDGIIMDSSGNMGLGLTPTNYNNYVTLALNDTTGSTIEGRVGGTLTGSFSVDSLVTINAVTSIPMVFKTANTERLRITSGGDATFKYKINVGDSYAGGEIFKLGKSSGTSYLAHYNAGTAHGFIGHADQLVSGGAATDYAIRATNELVFSSNGGPERLRIASNGRIIQIGKAGAASNPAIDPYASFVLNDAEARLQLCASDGGSNAAGIILSNENKHYVIHQRGPNASNRFDIGYYDSASPSDVHAQATRLLSLDSAGNMGLGVTPIAPGNTALHIGEDSSGQPVRLHMTTATTGATVSDGFTLSIDGSTSVVNMIQRENADITFYTNNTDRLLITSSGGYVQKSYGRALRYYTTTVNDSMYRTVVAISMNGNVAYEIRFSGTGNGITHAKCMASHWTSSYDLIRESYLATDSYSGMSVHDQINRTSGTQGAWSFGRPGNGQTGYQSHLIINKSAGSYGGGMVGCIVLESDRPYELLSIT